MGVEKAVGRLKVSGETPKLWLRCQRGPKGLWGDGMVSSGFGARTDEHSSASRLL